MQDKNAIYNEQILPLVKQIYDIAQQNGISMSMAFQTSDVDLWQSHLVARSASTEMKQMAAWWMQNADAQEIRHG